MVAGSKHETESESTCAFQVGFARIHPPSDMSLFSVRFSSATVALMLFTSMSRMPSVCVIVWSVPVAAGCQTRLNLNQMPSVTCDLVRLFLPRDRESDTVPKIVIDRDGHHLDLRCRGTSVPIDFRRLALCTSVLESSTWAPPATPRKRCVLDRSKGSRWLRDETEHSAFLGEMGFELVATMTSIGSL